MNKISKDTLIYRFDGVTATGIYIGSLDDLRLVAVRWRKDPEAGEYGINPDCLTLGEIAEQLEQYGLITVIVDSPLEGVIYQHGNYSDGEWYEIGQLCGYA